VLKVAAVALGGLAVAVLAVNAAFKVMSAVSLLASPLGIVLAAVGALAAGLIWLESKTGAVSATFKTLYSWLKTVWDFLSPIAASAFDGLKSAFTVVSTAGQEVWDVLKGLWGVVKPVVNFMKPILGAAFDGLKTAFRVLIDPVQKVKTALAIIDPILGPIISALKAVGSKAFDGLKTAFQALAVPINAVATALGKVKNLWDWVTSNIQGTGKNPFAPGGALANLTGSRSMALTPANLTSTRMAVAPVVQVNVQAGLVSSPDQVGQQIIEAIQRAQRRSGPAFLPA